MDKFEIDYKSMLKPDAVINLHIQQCKEIHYVLDILRERIKRGEMIDNIFFLLALTSMIEALTSTMRQFGKYNLIRDVVMDSDDWFGFVQNRLVQMKIEMTMFDNIVNFAMGYWSDLKI